LAFYAFPSSHWRKLRFTNPLERFSKEVGRRTDVLGILPIAGRWFDWSGCSASSRTMMVGRQKSRSTSIPIDLPTSTSTLDHRRENGGHHDTCGFTLAATPVKSQERPSTRTGSQQ
jgi:hypothetical protein